MPEVIYSTRIPIGTAKHLGKKREEKRFGPLENTVGFILRQTSPAYDPLDPYFVLSIDYQYLCHLWLMSKSRRKRGPFCEGLPRCRVVKRQAGDSLPGFDRSIIVRLGRGPLRA